MSAYAAIFFATINVVGGFLFVTDGCLSMFRAKKGSAK